VENTLAKCDSAKITAVKSFVIQAPGVIDLSMDKLKLTRQDLP
jgi:hypothetical protein